MENQTTNASLEKMLYVQASRISSLKSIFFPMKYEFFKDENGRVFVMGTTRNWIGQKTVHKQFLGHFRLKGFILRKMNFTATKYSYGRFWFFDCKKVKNFMKENTSERDRLEWSDVWF